MANEDAIGESSFRVDSVEVLRPEDFSLGAEDVLHIHHGAMSKVHLHGASAAEVLDALAGMLESNPRPGMNGDDIRGHYDRLLALDVDGAMVDDEGLEGLFDGFG
jgi:hypothetical protein